MTGRRAMTSVLIPRNGLQRTPTPTTPTMTPTTALLAALAHTKAMKVARVGAAAVVLEATLLQVAMALNGPEPYLGGPWEG